MTFTTVWRKFLLFRQSPVKSFANEFILFSLSTLAFQVSRLIVSIFAARWIGPVDFGIWNGLQLLLLYGIAGSLGVPNGMNRMVPILMGKEDGASIKSIITVSFTVTTIANLCVAIGIAIIALIYPVSESYRHPLLLMGLLFFVWQSYLYLQMLLKSNIRFHSMSLQQLFFACFFPIFVLPAAWYWGINGFIGSQIVVVFLTVLFIIRIANFRFCFGLDSGILASLVSQGFPIMAAGLLYSVLITTDRWMVAALLGPEALGHYTLAILCVGILSLLPAVISQQMYPRMAFHFGKTNDKRSLLPLLVQQSILSAVITWPMLLIAFWSLPLVTEKFMPAYIMGISPAQTILVGIAFLPIGSGIGNFLNSVGRQKLYLIAQVLAIAMNILLCALFLWNKQELNSIAVAVSSTYFLYTLVLILAAAYVYRN